MFRRLRCVADLLAGLMRLQLGSAQATQLSRALILCYKALSTGAKLHIGAKGA